MAVVITPQEEIDAYYASPDLSQSDLKGLLKGIDSFGRKSDEQQEDLSKKTAIKIGSAVDCILTSTEEEFDKRFVVTALNKLPSDAIVKIVEMVHSRLLEDYEEYLIVTMPVNGAITVWPEHVSVEQVELKESVNLPVSTFKDFAGTLQDWSAYVLEARSIVGWNARYGDEAALKGIQKEGITYFTMLCESYGKTLLTVPEYETVKNVVGSLRTHNRTSMYFNRADQEANEMFTFYYQFPVYFVYRGVSCKALLDLVVVGRDNQGKILSVLPIDLKTMFGNTFNFLSALKQRRYDIQGAFYTQALIDYFALENFPEAVKPFRFIVESSTKQGKPLVFKCSDSLLNIGRYGRPAVKLIDTNLFSDPSDVTPDVVIQKEILGFEQLLDKYIWHNENGWNEEQEIQEANGEPLLLDWEGIIT